MLTGMNDIVVLCTVYKLQGTDDAWKHHFLPPTHGIGEAIPLESYFPIKILDRLDTLVIRIHSLSDDSFIRRFQWKRTTRYFIGSINALSLGTKQKSAKTFLRMCQKKEKSS